MGFVIGRIAATVLMPLPVCIAGGLIGTLLWARGRRVRAGQSLVGFAFTGLALLSLAPVATFLARGQERAFPTFPDDSVDYVVVLGGGHVSDATVAPGARLSGTGLYRLVEGVRIATAQPWSTLVLSGWGGADPRSNAEVYRDVAVSLGFPADRTFLEGRPRTTAEEARLLQPVLAGHPFALVTSANHMPRATALFRARGLTPIPAPTGYLSLRVPGLNLADLVPNEGALTVARQAWYETLSRAWAAVRGDL